MRPVLKYRGGKSRELPSLLPYFPRKYETYIEPFLGGGAVFFALEPERAILNDINKPLMTFYRQLRDSYPLLRTELDSLQAEYEANQAEYAERKQQSPEELVSNRNEDLYYRMRERFNHPDGSLLEGTTYFFINKTAYSGMIRYNSHGEYNVPFGRYATLNTQIITPEHSHLLQKAQLFSEDYSRIFDLAGAEDFMFLDPPYDCVFHDYGNLTEETTFGEKQHRRLAEDFRNLPCKAVMVIGKTALTEELYSKYGVGQYTKRYSVNIRNRFQSEAVHLVVRNF